MTTIRVVCGTRAGLIAHQAAGEPRCGQCAYHDAVLRVAAERLAPPPAPLHMPPGRLAPVTPAEAAHHAAVLHAEVGEYEAGRTGRRARATILRIA